jgi:hypothetical protein
MATVGQAARHIDVSETWFIELVNRGTFKRAKRGGYDLDVIRLAYIKMLRGERKAVEGGGASTLSEARARKELAHAETAEFVNQSQKGEWARIDVLLEYLVAEHLMMREHFLILSGTTADSLHMVERDVAYLIVKDATYEALDRIASGRAVFQFAIAAIERAGGKPRLLELMKGYGDLQATCVEVDEAETLQKAKELAAPRKPPTVTELVDLLAGRTPREIYEILRDEWYRCVKESHSPDFVLPSPMIMRFAEVLVGRSKREIDAIFRAVLGAVEQVIHAELAKALDGLSDPNGVSFHGTRADVRGIRGVN